MNSPKKLMTLGVMAFALLLPGCSESGMRADQDQAEVPAGTQLYVRVNQNMPSDNQAWKSGDEFQGTLARALQVNGRVIASEGTIVKGELTDKIDTADNTGTTTPDTPAGVRPDADRSVTGDPTMSASRMDHARLGLELKKIVLNGEEYDIDTHAVPVPGMMASANEAAGYGKSTTKDRSDRDMSKDNKMDKESMAKAQIAGQEFVFTLEDKVDLPSTTNMKTE
jgi:hypothetical protein